MDFVEAVRSSPLAWCTVVSSAFGACRSNSMRTLVGGDAVAWTRPLSVLTQAPTFSLPRLDLSACFVPRRRVPLRALNP